MNDANKQTRDMSIKVAMDAPDLSEEQRKNLEDSFAMVLSQEIVRELLSEHDIVADDALIERLLAISTNPWDAFMVYTMLEVTGKL